MDTTAPLFPALGVCFALTALAGGGSTASAASCPGCDDPVTSSYAEAYFGPVPGVLTPTGDLRPGADGVLNFDVATGETGSLGPFAVQGTDFSGLNPVYKSGGFVPGAPIDGVAWEVDATALAPAVLADLRIAIVNADGQGVVINPFDGSTFSGTASASSGGFLDLNELVLSLPASDAGTLCISVFTAFDARPGDDIRINSATISFRTAPIPTPGAVALLGAGGLVAARRRRG